EDAPFLAPFYHDGLQAYRSDRFAGFRAQPDPGGVVLFQYGTYSYLNINTPQAPASADDGGSGVPLVPIAAGVAVLGAAGVLLALRRRSTQDERGEGGGPAAHRAPPR